MSNFVGVPSDELPDVLVAGRPDVTTLLVSMSGREPDGRDAEYIAWHALDHRPELSRLAALRGALRLVSTPACRAARAASEARYERVDHVMTYLFTDPAGLGPLGPLVGALGVAGRMPWRLPTVELGVYELAGTAAAPRALAGADVIPWRPARGVYLLVERDAGSPANLTEVPGVAGVWWSTGAASPLASADTTGLQLTYCYLDDDPIETAARLAGVVAERWTDGRADPLLAAPFHTVVPYDWGRHLP